MSLELISHYRIIKKLGAGGMGEVYLAEDIKLHRKVAIKFLPQESLSSERAKTRLIREARAAARLEHPNICSIYEIGDEDGKSFIVMQYIEGETLADRIRRKRLELSEVLDLSAQIADALAEAHSRGIIHRDIKPQNVMLTSKGKVKVLDFGLAKVVHRRQESEGEAETEINLTSSGEILGSVPYMSPEQIRSEPLDGRSDIFSFGTMIYEMVTGRHPFRNDTATATIAAILMREPPHIKEFQPEVSAELESVISKALCKDKENRYQSADELLSDIVNLQNPMKGSYKQTQYLIENNEAPTSAVSVSQTLPIEAYETGRWPSLFIRFPLNKFARGVTWKSVAVLAILLSMVAASFVYIAIKGNQAPLIVLPDSNEVSPSKPNSQPPITNQAATQPERETMGNEGKATKAKITEKKDFTAKSPEQKGMKATAPEEKVTTAKAPEEIEPTKKNLAEEKGPEENNLPTNRRESKIGGFFKRVFGGNRNQNQNRAVKNTNQNQ